MIDGLAGVKNYKGTVVFVCSQCGVAPDQAYGAQNMDQLAYMLVCPKCTRILGEWATIEERDRELRDFAKRVKLLS